MIKLVLMIVAGELRARWTGWWADAGCGVARGESSAHQSLFVVWLVKQVGRWIVCRGAFLLLPFFAR